MSDILSLLIDHGNDDDDYDYYERLAVAVELQLLIRLSADRVTP